MTNSDTAIREFAESKFDHLINEANKKLAEKYLPIKGYEFAIDKYALLKVKEHDDFLSDLTALISEHYVSKAEFDEQKRIYFRLFDEEINCMYCEAKIRRGSAIILCKECAENTEV